MQIAIPPDNLPAINTHAVVTYLLVAGTLFSFILLLLALLLLAYLAQLLLLSIGEVVHIFNAFDPLVRVFFILLACSTVVIWCTRKRR